MDASASASFSSASGLRRDGVFFGGRRSLCSANHVRCARAACRSAARAKSLGHVLSSLCRHLSANFAHAVSSSLRLTCDAAPSSHVCARASKSSRPVSACFSGLSSGNAKTRSQISASWDSKGCSGHSSSNRAMRSRVADTGATTRCISPAHPTSFKSAPSASAAASAAGSYASTSVPAARSAAAL